MGVNNGVIHIVQKNRVGVNNSGVTRKGLEVAELVVVAGRWLLPWFPRSSHNVHNNNISVSKNEIVNSDFNDNGVHHSAGHLNQTTEIKEVVLPLKLKFPEQPQIIILGIEINDLIGATEGKITPVKDNQEEFKDYNNKLNDMKNHLNNLINKENKESIKNDWRAFVNTQSDISKIFLLLSSDRSKDNDKKRIMLDKTVGQIDLQKQRLAQFRSDAQNLNEICDLFINFHESILGLTPEKLQLIIQHPLSPNQLDRIFQPEWFSIRVGEDILEAILADDDINKIREINDTANKRGKKSSEYTDDEAKKIREIMKEGFTAESWKHILEALKLNLTCDQIDQLTRIHKMRRIRTEVTQHLNRLEAANNELERVEEDLASKNDTVNSDSNESESESTDNEASAQSEQTDCLSAPDLPPCALSLNQLETTKLIKWIDDIMKAIDQMPKPRTKELKERKKYDELMTAKSDLCHLSQNNKDLEPITLASTQSDIDTYINKVIIRLHLVPLDEKCTRELNHLRAEAYEKIDFKGHVERLERLCSRLEWLCSAGELLNKIPDLFIDYMEPIGGRTREYMEPILRELWPKLITRDEMDKMLSAIWVTIKVGNDTLEAGLADDEVNKIREIDDTANKRGNISSKYTDDEEKEIRKIMKRGMTADQETQLFEKMRNHPAGKYMNLIREMRKVKREIEIHDMKLYLNYFDATLTAVRSNRWILSDFFKDKNASKTSKDWNNLARTILDLTEQNQQLKESQV